MPRVLIYTGDLCKDHSEETDKFLGHANENGGSLSLVFSDSEHLQHVSRGSEKASLDLLGAGIGRLALRAKFPVGEDTVGGGQPGSIPSLWNAGPSGSELNALSSEENDDNVGL